MAFALLTTCLLAAPGVDAAVYRYIDKNGQVHLSDERLHSGYRKLVRTWKGWREAVYDPHQFRVNQKRYAPLIAEAAREHHLPDTLLHAIVTAESAYDADALSSAGAVGLMQLMPATARRFGVANRNDPRANVNGGTRYFKVLLGMFDNDVSLALAAYNAGENAVTRHGNRIPPYPETRNYVRKVLDYYRRYTETRPDAFGAPATDGGSVR